MKKMYETGHAYHASGRRIRGWVLMTPMIVKVLVHVIVDKEI